MRFLVINIGGSSTKLSLAEDGRPVGTRTIRHPAEELRAFGDLWEQLGYRKQAVVQYLRENGVDVSGLDAIVSRGPSVKPLTSGVYRISHEMVEDARSRRYGNHPCALGCQIALELSGGRLPVLTVDPPCVDEMIPEARYTGLPEIWRRSFFQALNHKAVGRNIAGRLGKAYDRVNLVICHLGSGVSVASHKLGRVVDVTNGLDGDAPFGLDRVGTLPAGDWMRYCLSGQHTKEELTRLLGGHGGLMAHLGTNDAIEVERRIAAGDKNAREVYAAMAFQAAKGIGAAACALGVRPDAIGLTGGLANSDRFTAMVEDRVGWMAPVIRVPEEDEMAALSTRAYSALQGQEPVLEYGVCGGAEE